MSQVLKTEFSPKKFCFNPSNDGHVAKSWILPSWGLMALRLVMALFCTTIIIISGVRADDPTWFIFLTNWGFFLLTIAMITLSLVSIIHLVSQSNRTLPGTTTDDGNNDRQDLFLVHTWYQKFAWVFWIIASNGAFIVTLFYWVLVFKPPTDFMDIAVHALNTVVVLIELFMGSIPVHILHAVYVMIVAAIYSIFTVVYWAAGGVNERGEPYIYEVLDFESGNRGTIAGILLATVFLVVPFVQLVSFVLYQLRCCLSGKINCSYA